MIKKEIKFLGLLIITILFCFQTVNAKVLEANDELNITGTYETSRFMFGNEIEDKSTINGIGFIAGNNIEAKGTHEYGVYAGNNITVSGHINKDLFIAGNIIKIEKDTIIGRDAYIAGKNITINNNITGTLRVTGSIIDLTTATINGDVYISAEELKLGEKTTINGKLSYNSDIKLTGKDKATINEIQKRKEKINTAKEKVIDKVKTFLINTISSFITMIVLFYLLPVIKEKLNKNKIKKDTIIKEIGMGIVLLILIPIISIPAIFIKYTTPIGLICIILYIILIYLTRLFTSYIVGKYLNDKFIKKDITSISLIIGILIINLLVLIPTIGEIINVLCVVYGFSLVYKLLQKEKKK